MAPIRRLAWESPHAAAAAIEKDIKRKKKKKKNRFPKGLHKTSRITQQSFHKQVLIMLIHSLTKATVPFSGHLDPQPPPTNYYCEHSTIVGKPHTARLTDRIHAVCEQQGPGAAPSGRGGGLGSRMSSTNDYHVEVRSPGRRAITAEPGRGEVLFDEESRNPAATTSEGEHGWKQSESKLRTGY
uniref:Uncharacterized protein n=1 Tax=Sus scrofa TaxID=9823 RepID=A0A8D1UY70_PIG